MDSGAIGWILAFLHWGSLLVIVAGLGFATYILAQSAEDAPTRIAIESLIEEAKKSQEKQ